MTMLIKIKMLENKLEHLMVQHQSLHDVSDTHPSRVDTLLEKLTIEVQQLQDGMNTSCTRLEHLQNLREHVSQTLENQELKITLMAEIPL